MPACGNRKQRTAFLIKIFLKSSFIIPWRIDLEALPDRKALTVDRRFAGGAGMGQQSVTEYRISYDFKIIELPV